MRARSSSPPGVDSVLAALFVATLVLCLHGITATVLHPDQMALRPLFLPDAWPLNPKWFEKPPGYSYLNLVLAVAPVSLAGRLVQAAPETVHTAAIVWSRVVAAGCLLGAVYLTYAIAREAYGRTAARVVAAFLATGAGMIAFVHQLTADIPVMAGMLVAFHFALAAGRDGRTSSYVLAGLFTGFATALKYNGLGVGIAIVVIHVLRIVGRGDRPRTWLRRLVGPEIVLGLAAVPIGFIFANPYAVLDAPTFLADFRYNAMVAPVYEGQTGSSYGAFFLRVAELIGWPAFLLTAAAALVAFGTMRATAGADQARRTFAATLAVTLLYYATFGRFPRLETRFVLPIVPFLLLLSGPGWSRITRRPRLAVVALAVLYNLVSAGLIGRRFLDDPRLAAATWLRANVPAGSHVESDLYSPGDDARPEARRVATAMPFVTGRERLFLRIFPGNEFVNGTPAAQRAAEEKVTWYSLAALERRAPDVVVVNSLYYDRFVAPGIRRDLYPSMDAFFRTLLAEESPYRIAFDRRSSPVPAFLYPRDIDFLDNRTTIFVRSKRTQ